VAKPAGRITKVFFEILIDQQYSKFGILNGDRAGKQVN
jgi:hypothetical protein